MISRRTNRSDRHRHRADRQQRVAVRRHLLLLGALVVLLGNQTHGSERHESSDTLAEALQTYCVKCHGGSEGNEGEIDLVLFLDSDDMSAHVDLMKSLVDVLEFGSMPPEDEPAPTDDVRNRIRTQLQKRMRDTLAQDAEYAPTPIRRMTRFQYANAVRDLFDLKVEVLTLPERMLRDYGYFDPASGKMPAQLKAGSRPLGKSQLIEKRLAGVAAFPQDLRAENGFDNQADHLSLSPLLLESFLQLSQSIVDSPDFTPQNCGRWSEIFEPVLDGLSHAAAEAHLRNFMQRAFRGPVQAEDLGRYTDYLLFEIDQGASFTDAMKSISSAVLASPRFLYLYDRDRSHKNDDFELASRLSFFLWGSIPDAQLLDLAATGKLGDAAVLEEQVDRMLSDVRMKRFCDSFPAQWLQLDRIISSVPDREQFPEFYFAKYRVSMHMMLEPLLLFETILVENRSILELLDSDYSYRSELLESWYDDSKQVRAKPPTVIPFRRLAVNDRREGGVITNAAVMTMTSNPQRTQPITRGAWIASVIFNSPPPPPPADVPPLPEDDAAEVSQDLTLRERLDAHRTRADCAGCHAKIDPLGFALENYGPTGRWRDHYENGREVDSRGVLFRQHPFDNVIEFKAALLSQKDRFTRGFAEHLLSFALGRELTPADSLAIEQVVTETIAADYRLRDLIKQIVLSEPFLR